MKRKMLRPKLAVSKHRRTRPAEPTVAPRQQPEDSAASISDFPQENPSPVLRISPSGVLQYANPAGQRHLREWGWAVGQVVTHDWQEWIAAAIRSGVDREIEIRAADRIFALNLHPHGPAGYVNVYGHDITERKRAEAALRDSQERLANIIDTASEAIISTDQKQRILLFNKAAENIFGYRSEEVLGQPLSLLLPHRFSEIHGQRLQAFEAAAERAHAMGAWRVVVGQRKNGTEFSLQAGISKTITDGPVIYTFIGIDTTEHQRAEEALQNSEKRFRALMENGLDSISLLAADGTLLWESPAVFRTLGYTPDEFVGRNTFELMHPDDLEWARNILAELVRQPASRQRGSFRLRHGDGTWRWVEAVVTNLLNEPAVNAIVINYHDVTERKRADESLRVSEEKFRSFVEQSSEGVVLLDEHGKIVEWNHAQEQITGIPRAQAVGTPFGDIQYEILPPEHRAGRSPEFFRKALAAAFQTGQVPPAAGANEIAIQTATGERKSILQAAFPIKTDQGYRVGALVRDITERKRAEQALRDSEERYRTIFQTAAVSIWEEDFSAIQTALDNLRAQGVTDLPGYMAEHPEFVRQAASMVKVRDVNQATLRMLGAQDKVELLGALDQIIVPEALKNLRDQIVAIAEGRAYFEGESVNQTLDGRRINLWLTMTVPTKKEQLNSVLVSVIDITQRKRAEEEITRRLAELEAVNRISKAVRTAKTLDEMLTVWLDVTLAVMHANGGSVWLYDYGADELRPAVTRGWTHPAGAGPVPPQKPGVGVKGYVFVTGQPYVSSDFQLDPRLAPGIRERIPPGGGASVPIRVGDQVIGIFVVNTPVGRAVTPGEVHLLTTLSEIAGSAIHRMRLFEQTEQRLSRITTLRAIDAAITASLDVRVTLEVFLEQVVQQLGMHAADVLLLDPDSRTLQYAAGRGFHTRDFEHARVLVGQGRAGRVALERRLMVIAETGAVDPPSGRTASLQRENFTSYVGVPLIAKGQVLGVLELFHRAPLPTNPEWLQFVETLAGQAAIALDNARLYDNLQQANQELVLAYDATIEGWSAALDLRDKETEGHTQRVTNLTDRLARLIGLSEGELVHIRRGSLLHDIGKMGIPDTILLKPGPLTDAEWVIMRQHPTFAYRLLEPIHFLRPALEIPYCHHEKWDGTGYPRGLKGEQIPLAARVFAMVDVWDALRSDRPYRAAWPADRVREHIRSLAGTHFDPQIVNVVLESGVLARH